MAFFSQRPLHQRVRLSWFRQWLGRNRASSRVAFLLRTGCLAITAATSLLWARLLVQTLGKEVYGIYLTFLSVAQLGGVGDLGISGGLTVRMTHHLAKGEECRGRALLANARGVFLSLALFMVVTFFVLSPWLPGWLGFPIGRKTGSLSILFALGGAGAALLILGGYVNNLNYVHGNLVWPILPNFLLAQLGLAAQWILARQEAPLWGQYSANLVVTFTGIALGWWMLRISHRWLGDSWPIRFDFAEIRALAGTSFYAYLCALGSLVYVTTDQLLVNAGFGAGTVPPYRFNYKLCELVTTTLITASFVAMPALVGRLLSPDPGERLHGLRGIDRLQKFQAFAAGASAMGYLWINDTFVGWWFGPDFRMPLGLQTAFALNLAVTVAGDAALQTRGRLTFDGLRMVGITVGATALLNLALSSVAVKVGWLSGIAFATVAAQSVLSIAVGRSLALLLEQSWKAWVWRSCFAPLLVVGAFAFLRQSFPPASVGNIMRLGGGYTLLAISLALALGLTPRLLMDEWERLRATSR